MLQRATLEKKPGKSKIKCYGAAVPNLFCSRTPKQKKKKTHVPLCKILEAISGFFSLTIFN